jgi:hypothetical protein
MIGSALYAVQEKHHLKKSHRENNGMPEKGTSLRNLKM